MQNPSNTVAKLRCVPRRGSVKTEAGLPSWFLTVVCQGWCVGGLLETYKLEIFEAICSLVGCKGKIDFVVSWNETTVLDSALDLWSPGHFTLGFFTSRIRRLEMECSALGFSYVSWKPRNGQLAKLGSFHQSKRSDNKWYAVKVRWIIFIENLTYRFIP